MKYLKSAISILTLVITVSTTQVVAQPQPDPDFCECPEGFIPSGECEDNCDQDPDLCCIENKIPLQKSEANVLLIAAGLCLVVVGYYKQDKKSKSRLLHDIAQDS